MTTLKLGYVPLTDAAPLIVAQAKGFFTDEGLAVELVREVSWATIRDKVAAGVLDGAHMLAPMALAAAMGVGSEPADIIAPLALARGGGAVTLSSRLGEAADAGALARLIARRRDEGASVLTLAVVYPYSIHNYLLRTWLSAAGVDPDQDVRLTVAAPSRLADLLADGVIEGFCAGEPWGSRAQLLGVGRVALRIGELWPAAPDKVLGVRGAWAVADPQRLSALLRAVQRAQAWADAADHRREAANILSRPEHLAQPADLIAAGLEHLVFAREGAARPDPADADWLLAEMRRWGQVAEAATASVYRPDLFDVASA